MRKDIIETAVRGRPMPTTPLLNPPEANAKKTNPKI
jgi:hypothetical protein